MSRKQIDWLLDRAIGQAELITNLTVILFQMDDIYDDAEQLARCRQAVADYVSKCPPSSQGR